MNQTLDFYFDFGSPTAYLAHQRLKQLIAQYDLEVTYVPMLLGGIFKATGNASPVTIPAKGAYMANVDLPRFAQRYGVPLAFNPFFPINTLALMRGALAAQALDCFDAYLNAIYNAVWINEKNMGELDIIVAVLEQAGLDAPALLATSQTPEIKQQLIDNTNQAVKRGVFGAPTMFMDDQMFFGQDRLDFIEEALSLS